MSPKPLPAACGFAPGSKGTEVPKKPAEFDAIPFSKPAHHSNGWPGVKVCDWSARVDDVGWGYGYAVLVDILIAVVIVAIAALLGVVVHPILWVIVVAAVLWLFFRRGRWT
jgi:hypothetical protein